jgi:hypothetical protein
VNSGISVTLCRDLPKKTRNAREWLETTRNDHKGSLWNMRGTIHIEKKPEKKQDFSCFFNESLLLLLLHNSFRFLEVFIVKKEQVQSLPFFKKRNDWNINITATSFRQFSDCFARHCR